MLPERAPAPSEQESVGSLVARLTDDVRRIVRAEGALLQARAGAVGTAVRAVAALLVVGVVLALGGLGALVAGVVLLVGQWLGPWQGAFVVGGALVVLGALLLALQGRLLTGGVREALGDVGIDVRGGGRRGD